MAPMIAITNTGTKTPANIVPAKKLTKNSVNF